MHELFLYNINVTLGLILINATCMRENLCCQNVTTNIREVTFAVHHQLMLNYCTRIMNTISVALSDILYPVYAEDYILLRRLIEEDQN